MPQSAPFDGYDSGRATCAVCCRVEASHTRTPPPSQRLAGRDELAWQDRDELDDDEPAVTPQGGARGEPAEEVDEEEVAPTRPKRRRRN